MLASRAGPPLADPSSAEPGPSERMPNPRAFTIASRLATATAVLMFALVVVGSVVRTTGSGLACPDWPLCHGQLIPPMQFNIFIEWFHRLLALVVSLGLAATVGWVAVHSELRARLGGLALLAMALLAVQILLGALTVWKLLDPSVVSGHLAVALLLFASVVTLATVARLEARPPGAPEPRPAGLLPLLGVTTLALWGQSVLGGIVSTNHASLVCPDWPTCGGAWFPPLEGLVGVHMLHRYVGYGVAVLVCIAAARTRHASDPTVRLLGHLIVIVTFKQVALGIVNLLLGVPVFLSAIHLANAAVLVALSLVATLRVAALPAPKAALEGVPAR